VTQPTASEKVFTIDQDETLWCGRRDFRWRSATFEPGISGIPSRQRIGGLIRATARWVLDQTRPRPHANSQFVEQAKKSFPRGRQQPQKLNSLQSVLAKLMRVLSLAGPYGSI